MPHVSDSLRDQVEERARGRCEYCQTQQAIVVSMEIDHIVPESARGETTLDNLCLACIGCNGFKRDYLTGIDPDTAQVTPLFHPRRQLWRDHFQWSGDGTQLIGLTAIGRATIHRLRINREAVVKARQRWVAAGWHPPQDQD